jgi:hypothetical protein
MNCCPDIPPPVFRMWDPLGDSWRMRVWRASGVLPDGSIVSLAFRTHAQAADREGARRLANLGADHLETCRVT